VFSAGFSYRPKKYTFPHISGTIAPTAAGAGNRSTPDTSGTKTGAAAPVKG